MKAPIAKKIPVTSAHHNAHQLVDDYAWLRQSNWKEMFENTSLLDDDIRSYLQAENDYTEQNFFTPEKALIDTLINEMKDRIEICYDSASVIDGEYEYFTRYSEADYPVFLRRKTGSDHEEILLDVNTELAGENKKVFLRKAMHSPDHKSFAVLVDYTGSENYAIKIKNIASGAMIGDDVRHAGNMHWGKDSSEFYYTRFCDDPEKFYQDRVFKHRIGEPQAQDTLMYHEHDPSYQLEISKTSSGRFILIELVSKDVHECNAIDLDNAQSSVTSLVPRALNILCEVDHGRVNGEDVFFIRHNADGAMDYQISTVPVANPAFDQWTVMVPHQAGLTLQEHQVFADHLVYIQREKFLQHVVVTDLKTNESHNITFNDPAYHVLIANAAGFNSNQLRLVYTSPRTPMQFFNYDMTTRERQLVRQENIANHNPDDYIVDRLFILTHDGMEMPLTITRHKDTPLDGSAPLWLYGYGSYGSVLPSSFNRANYRYPLINRGFIYVDAHIRGGGELGRQWYLNGKMMNKKNTFLDFITAAEWLVAQNYTTKGKIAIEGRSAGGLLMGAVVNMAPEGLFGAMVADVPFVDLMYTMMDLELPLTPPEWTEWGNPIKDKDAFEYMLSYSPYDNVSARTYPPMLITGGLTDPRVTYWEPAKWAAKLRVTKTDTNPLYLYIAMDSGHGGDPGRFGHLPEIARSMAFMLQM